MAHYRPDPKEVTKRGAKASVGRYAASGPAGDRKPPDRAIGFVGMLTIRGYASTAKKHGHQVFTVIYDALAGNAWIPPVPADA